MRPDTFGRWGLRVLDRYEKARGDRRIWIARWSFHCRHSAARRLLVRLAMDSIGPIEAHRLLLRLRPADRTVAWYLKALAEVLAGQVPVVRMHRFVRDFKESWANEAGTTRREEIALVLYSEAMGVFGERGT